VVLLFLLPEIGQRLPRGLGPVEMPFDGVQVMSAGSAPAAKSFRGLLGVHVSYGLPARRIARTILSTGGFDNAVASIAAPIATG
jgi:hypothetical protein